MREYHKRHRITENEVLDGPCIEFKQCACIQWRARGALERRRNLFLEAAVRGAANLSELRRKWLYSHWDRRREVGEAICFQKPCPDLVICEVSRVLYCPRCFSRKDPAACSVLFPEQFIRAVDEFRSNNNGENPEIFQDYGEPPFIYRSEAELAEAEALAELEAADHNPVVYPVLNINAPAIAE